ncbi:MAG: 50S ribosomal protein L22 [Armatimonadetes bacterium]|nr:50S ribosomal protein L22 [Armatimonadota bacterium]MDW8121164.1 50S ribosomal protein L22 [Armatimonadota bacterium]
MQEEKPTIRARQRFLRLSASKALLIARLIRGKRATEALHMLTLMPHKAARYYARLLKQAIGNAVNDYDLSESDLVVVEAVAEQGPTFKRFRPRARGRVYPIRKRTAHLSVTITTKEGS